MHELTTKDYGHIEVNNMAKIVHDKVYLRFAERKNWCRAVYIEDVVFINIGHQPPAQADAKTENMQKKQNDR